MHRIEAVDLSIGFPEETIVSSINFTLDRGEAMALIGTNGSGKSTLLKTIVGLLPTIGGRLEVVGKKPGAAPKKIAYLGQFHHSGFVLPLRAVDVVRMGRFPTHGLMRPMGTEDDDIVRTAMRTMGIDKLGDRPLRSMSGGQQQRTYLAQVLAHGLTCWYSMSLLPGSDVGGRELYLHAINDEICRGASLLISTHDIQDEAALCTQVMLLARKVVALGPPEKVLTPEALLEAFGIVVSGGQNLHILECQHRDEVDGTDASRRFGS